MENAFIFNIVLNEKIKLIWIILFKMFGLVLWHINQCRLFNAKSFLNIVVDLLGVRNKDTKKELS